MGHQKLGRDTGGLWEEMKALRGVSFGVWVIDKMQSLIPLRKTKKCHKITKSQKPTKENQ